MASVAIGLFAAGFLYDWIAVHFASEPVAHLPSRQSLINTKTAVEAIVTPHAIDTVTKSLTAIPETVTITRNSIQPLPLTYTSISVLTVTSVDTWTSTVTEQIPADPTIASPFTVLAFKDAEYWIWPLLGLFLGMVAISVIPLAIIACYHLRKGGLSISDVLKSWWPGRKTRTASNGTSTTDPHTPSPGKEHHTADKQITLILETLQRLEQTINPIQERITSIEVNMPTVRKILEQVWTTPFDETKFPSSQPAPTPESSPKPRATRRKPATTAKEKTPPKQMASPKGPDSSAEIPAPKEGTPIPIDYPMLDTDHWWRRVARISRAADKIKKREAAPGDFVAAGTHGLHTLADGLDNDYHPVAIRTIIEKTCLEPNMLLDPNSRVRQMQTRVMAVEARFEDYIASYGSPGPTRTFNPYSSSDSDDGSGDEEPVLLLENPSGSRETGTQVSSLQRPKTKSPPARSGDQRQTPCTQLIPMQKSPMSRSRGQHQTPEGSARGTAQPQELDVSPSPVARNPLLRKKISVEQIVFDQFGFYLTSVQLYQFKRRFNGDYLAILNHISTDEEAFRAGALYARPIPGIKKQAAVSKNTHTEVVEHRDGGKALTAQEQTRRAQEYAPPVKVKFRPAEDKPCHAEEKAPPVQEEAPPVQEEAPPVQEEAPPVQEEAPPVQEEAPPVQEEKPPPEEKLSPVQKEADAVDKIQDAVREEAERPASPHAREVIPAEPSPTMSGIKNSLSQQTPVGIATDTGTTLEIEPHINEGAPMEEVHGSVEPEPPSSASSHPPTIPTSDLVDLSTTEAANTFSSYLLDQAMEEAPNSVPLSEPTSTAPEPAQPAQIPARERHFTKDQARKDFERSANRDISAAHAAAFEAAFGSEPPVLKNTGAIEYLCGLLALIISVREQHPDLPVPTVPELEAEVEEQAYIDFGYSTKRDDAANFSADQLAFILLSWGLNRGFALQLGYYLPNRGPVLYPTDVDSSPDNRIVWIHNDNAADNAEDAGWSTEGLFNHWSGLQRSPKSIDQAKNVKRTSSDQAHSSTDGMTFVHPDRVDARSHPTGDHASQVFQEDFPFGAVTASTGNLSNKGGFYAIMPALLNKWPELRGRNIMAEFRYILQANPELNQLAQANQGFGHTVIAIVLQEWIRLHQQPQDLRLGVVVERFDHAQGGSAKAAVLFAGNGEDASMVDADFTGTTIWIHNSNVEYNLNGYHSTPKDRFRTLIASPQPGPVPNQGELDIMDVLPTASASNESPPPSAPEVEMADTNSPQAPRHISEGTQSLTVPTQSTKIQATIPGLELEMSDGFDPVVPSDWGPNPVNRSLPIKDSISRQLQNPFTAIRKSTPSKESEVIDDFDPYAPSEMEMDVEGDPSAQIEKSSFQQPQTLVTANRPSTPSNESEISDGFDPRVPWGFDKEVEVDASVKVKQQSSHQPQVPVTATRASTPSKESEISDGFDPRVPWGFDKEVADEPSPQVEQHRSQQPHASGTATHVPSSTPSQKLTAKIPGLDLINHPTESSRNPPPAIPYGEEVIWNDDDDDDMGGHVSKAGIESTKHGPLAPSTNSQRSKIDSSIKVTDGALSGFNKQPVASSSMPPPMSGFQAQSQAGGFDNGRIPLKNSINSRIKLIPRGRLKGDVHGSAGGLSEFTKAAENPIPSTSFSPEISADISSKNVTETQTIAKTPERRIKKPRTAQPHIAYEATLEAILDEHCRPPSPPATIKQPLSEAMVTEEDDNPANEDNKRFMASEAEIRRNQEAQIASAQNAGVPDSRQQDARMTEATHMQTSSPPSAPPIFLGRVETAQDEIMGDVQPVSKQKAAASAKIPSAKELETLMRLKGNLRRAQTAYTTQNRKSAKNWKSTPSQDGPPVSLPGLFDRWYEDWEEYVRALGPAIRNGSEATQLVQLEDELDGMSFRTQDGSIASKAELKEELVGFEDEIVRLEAKTTNLYKYGQVLKWEKLVADQEKLMANGVKLDRQPKVQNPRVRNPAQKREERNADGTRRGPRIIEPADGPPHGPAFTSKPSSAKNPSFKKYFDEWNEKEQEKIELLKKDKFAAKEHLGALAKEIERIKLRVLRNEYPDVYILRIELANFEDRMATAIEFARGMNDAANQELQKKRARFEAYKRKVDRDAKNKQTREENEARAQLRLFGEEVSSDSDYSLSTNPDGEVEMDLE